MTTDEETQSSPPPGSDLKLVRRENEIRDLMVWCQVSASQIFDYKSQGRATSHKQWYYDG